VERQIAGLEVAAKELENRQAVVTATVDEEWLNPFMKSASRQLAGRLDIPGFRRGKAPYSVVLRHAGREALVREVMEDVSRKAYEEAVEESGLEPINLDDLEVAEWDPLTLKMTVSLAPVVELGDYRSVPLEAQEVEIGEEEIDEVLQELRMQYAERVSVERPAQISDFALLDVEGTVEDRVVLSLEQQEYELREGDDTVVSNFVDEVLGMSPGEEKRFAVQFPEDYQDEDLAGQDVDLLVRLVNLQERHLPPADDELARMVGGFETIQELREDVHELLQLRQEARQLDELAEGLLDTLLEQSEVDSPPVFVNREVEVMVRGLALDLQEQGFTLDGYLNTTGRTLDDLLDEFRPTAEKRVKKSLLLAELVEEESIEVNDADIEEEVARMTRVYGQQKGALSDALLANEQIREEIRNRLYGRKLAKKLADLSEPVDSIEGADKAAPQHKQGSSKEPREEQGNAESAVSGD
jgi:trigger factor